MDILLDYNRKPDTGRKISLGAWYNLIVVTVRGRDTIYDTDKLARFFGVKERTVLEWCRKGKLPAFKIGKKWKIRVIDLQKMIDGKVRTGKISAPKLL